MIYPMASLPAPAISSARQPESASCFVSGSPETHAFKPELLSLGLPISPRSGSTAFRLLAVNFKSMETESPSSSDLSFGGRPTAFRVAFAQAVFLVTAIAGTLDIIAAHLHIWAASGSFPTRVFKGIAAGAFGRERVMQGGTDMVLFGVIFHYFISFSFTLLFFLLYPRLSLLRKNIFATALICSLTTWFTMNFIVLPLSALHSSTPDFANKHTYIGFCVLTAIFGLPIAFGAGRFHKQQLQLARGS